MIYHLKTKHPRIKLVQEDTQSTSGGVGQLGAASRIRKSPFNIFHIRNKVQKKELFHITIPDWVESKTMLKRTSEKAKRLDKYLFDQLVLDCVPFTEVEKPGLLRNYQILAPNFEVGSEKHYRYASFDEITDCACVE